MNEKILFYNRSVTDILADNNRNIFKDLHSIDRKKLSKTNQKEISEEVYQKNKLKNISMDLDDMKVMEYDSDHLKMGIPINEGKELLDVRPTNEYGSVHPIGALENGFVTKIFRLTDDTERLKRNIEIWKEVLDLYVNNLNEDIIHYHKHLLKDIEGRIEDIMASSNDLDERVNSLEIELGIRS